MTDHARKMLQTESAYLAGVSQKLENAHGRDLAGSIWKTVHTDAGDKLRAVMARHRVYDRSRLKEFPHNRLVAHHGYQRTWWFGKRPTGVAVASVIAPLEHIVANPNHPPPPIDLPDLMDHVRRIVTDENVPYVIGLCAPSGFTPEAKAWVATQPNVTLVLIEPRHDGGWNISAPDDETKPFVTALFNPESDDDRVTRAESLIKSRSADLLTGGIDADHLAQSLNLAKDIIAKAMKRVADADDELKLSNRDGALLLYRGAASAGTEKKAMSMVDRIRSLFAKEGDESAKINVLAERRAGLSQKRDRMYEEIGNLEDRESELLQKGKDSQSAVTRRRLAAQLAQLRKDISRQNTAANMLNKQIDIISTDIHNLTLIRQGEMAQLPTTEELTENAVAAEELLETLQADADLVTGLETGISEIATSAEELDILKEFEQADISEQHAAPRQESQPLAQPPQKNPTRRESQSPTERSRTPTAPEFDTPPTQKSAAKPQKRADPEA